MWVGTKATYELVYFADNDDYYSYGYDVAPPALDDDDDAGHDVENDDDVGDDNENYIYFVVVLVVDIHFVGDLVLVTVIVWCWRYLMTMRLMIEMHVPQPVR